MSETVIVIRTPSGISGDMLVTGLSQLIGYGTEQLIPLINKIGILGLQDSIEVVPWSVNQISGWKLNLQLPDQTQHRSHQSIRSLIETSSMAEPARTIALRAFSLLAEAEARVHNLDAQQVTFHEVGALDSIIDICLAAQLYVLSKAAKLYCSPLPICDGNIHCAHGLLASPAPAVQELLGGIPVYGIDSEGETVTPTALAFLKAVNSRFGNWPEFTMQNCIRAYGSRVLENVPNGAIFSLGEGTS
jgi:uncharacterized protein (DUF111 family)